jgi:hypothetical protein
MCPSTVAHAITVFGKDCSENVNALADWVAANYHKFPTDLYFKVGVESFANALNQAEMDVELIERPALDTAQALCLRLSELLDCDEVLALPIQGRMTKVELGMAREANLPVRRA